MAASIDVVVPVYNQYAITAGCLGHLARQTAHHRVIVVDDGSTDGTSGLLQRDWPDVAVVELGSNRGYTHAVNHGVRAGDAEYLVVLNNDVHLRADFLERLVAPLEAEPRVGSVAALMLAPGEATIDSFGITADATLAGFARLRGHPAAHASRREPVLTGPEGTAGAYRRLAWEQVGGLDERLLAYMETLDLALRLRTAGWHSAGAPEAIGVHLGSVSYGRRSTRQRRLSGFSRGYLLRRYGVMRSCMAPRTLLTEMAVVVGDLVLSRDVESLRGRIQGWRGARRLGRHPRPPRDAIDMSISLRRSLALRRAALRPHDKEGAPNGVT